MVLLSFDTEEFDVPREHGVEIPFARSVAISVEGTVRILDALKHGGVRATFFCTADFAGGGARGDASDSGRRARGGVARMQPLELLNRAIWPGRRSGWSG